LEGGAGVGAGLEDCEDVADRPRCCGVVGVGAAVGTTAGAALEAAASLAALARAEEVSAEWALLGSNCETQSKMVALEW
jgi:hypothetical protein